MTLYAHTCGQRYHRTSLTTPPRHCMMICERCLEPMPICDGMRAAYIYEAVQGIQFRRPAAQSDWGGKPGSEHPPLRPSAIIPLFPAAGRATAP